MVIWVEYKSEKDDWENTSAIHSDDKHWKESGLDKDVDAELHNPELIFRICQLR